MEVSKLARSLTPMLLVTSLSCAVACGDDETCKSVSAYRFDSERQCYGDGEEVPAIEACVGAPEKGTALECVRSPEGELYMVMRNGAASLNSDSWTLEAQLDAAEQDACDKMRPVGFPSPRTTCPVD